MIATLEIKKLILELNIGVEQEERNKLQDIEFNITINFAQPPKACTSNQINDTICYADLVEKIKIFCSNHSFKLIEHLCFKLYEYLTKDCLSLKDTLILQVCKNPPIENVKGKCCFTIKDSNLI